MPSGRNRPHILHIFKCNFFLKRKSLDFDPNFTEVCSWGPIINSLKLNQFMVSRRIDNKPLAEQMMTRYADASINQSGLGVCALSIFNQNDYDKV